MNSAKILIVEDESIVALDLKHRLMELGYVVTAVTNSGEKAIQQAAETRPDLVLMDIRLNGKMDGIETARHFQDKFKVPVIYLTALANDDTLARAKATNFCGYILKPFDERELHNAVRYALVHCKST